MRHNHKFWLIITLFAISSLACNAFVGGAEPIAPPPPPITTTPGIFANGTVEGELIEGLAPTVTPDGGSPSDGDATATPDSPTVTVLIDLNVRGGPGVQYDRITFYLAGESAPIIGKDPETGWWKVECPSRTPVTGVQCWLSGGAQYSQSANTDGVPIAEIPPTPTPPPPELLPSQGIIAYIEDGRLFLTPLNLDQNPATINDPVPISPAELTINNAVVSPDGRRVAYLSLDYPTELRVANIDGSGDSLLLSSIDLPDPVSIDQIEWFPNGQGLVFNTMSYSPQGGPVGSLEDLWAVTLAGEVTAVLDKGRGGGKFHILPNNIIILSSSGVISRVNLDGTGFERIIPFDQINTASEYIYYPDIQPASDGLIYVAIPGPEPFFGDDFTTLWRFASDGAAEQLNNLSQNIVLGNLRWSPDGNHVGYSMSLDSGASTLELAGGSGRNSAPYTRDSQPINFLDWSPNNSHFLYSSGNSYFLGQANDVSQQLGNGNINSAYWVSDSQFVFSLITDSGYQIVTGSIDGAQQLLLPISNNPALQLLDVWTP